MLIGSKRALPVGVKAEVKERAYPYSLREQEVSPLRGRFRGGSPELQKNKYVITENIIY